LSSLDDVAVSAYASGITLAVTGVTDGLCRMSQNQTSWLGRKILLLTAFFLDASTRLSASNDISSLGLSRRLKEAGCEQE